ncbi:outer dynein arm-docking complex subunit 4-like [Macrosteles quadrilineatus]|uniref:outer dynein arm-docking complex subunit 4-like n=1 Tax=Macrosteles quadrilineatus TaxID=74068 RepID=UPI0023E2226E|nr:outer dynein arm-docking complex subunit 4-like [Macrosteles quadrilineatus]XP_054284045.1 outer dynein arm-docking complex subunit 4-like [Macrosteles quadrilineatus]
MGDMSGDIQISSGGHTSVDILKISANTEYLHSFLRVDHGEETGSEAGDANKGKKPLKKKPTEGEVRTERRRERDRPRSPSTPPPAGPTSFQQIKREIIAKAKAERQKLLKAGKRSKKDRVRMEEIYTDKDRAAAVNMGSRDIKHSLKMKRRQDRSKALQIPEEAEPSTLLALGSHELRSGDVDIAIGFVNKALELCSTDKNALVARSKCYLLLGEPNLALKDAETALASDKSFVKGILQKAEALYHLGDFEHALMYYHRGLRIRPEMQEFRLGVQKSQEAIENTIGNKVGSKLTLPPYLEQSRPNSKVSSAGPGGRPSVASSERGKSAICVDELIKNTASSKKAEKMLLGELNVDKEYLEELLKHPDIKCLHKEMANNPIQKYAEEGVAFIKNRQEFWRQQRCDNSGGATKRKRPSKKQPSTNKQS